MEDNVEYIDMTPTWEGILPILLDRVVHGNFNAKDLASTELRRMARLADKYVASQNQFNNPSKEEK